MMMRISLLMMRRQKTQGKIRERSQGCGCGELEGNVGSELGRLSTRECFGYNVLVTFNHCGCFGFKMLVISFDGPIVSNHYLTLYYTDLTHSM